MKKLSNPFVIGRYAGDYYFCDREKETDFLLKQVENGRDVVLISPRRMGKSGLISHFFDSDAIKSHYNTLFIDIYSTSTPEEFALLLGRSIIDTVRKDRSLLRKALDALRTIRPLVKIDAVTGEPALELKAAALEYPEMTLKEIFDYMQASERPYIVAIDEFQQISSYKGFNMEAKLRTFVQSSPNIRFIFSGSEQSMMAEMFLSSRKPFYQSCITMGLLPIPRDTYRDFAMTLFNDYGKTLSASLFDEVYSKYEGITWYVQMMLNELFAISSEGGLLAENAIAAAEENIIGVMGYSYQEMMARFSPRQRLLMSAMARNPELCGSLTSASFLKASGFATPAMVQAAVKRLLKEGVVTRRDGVYTIYDAFFLAWLRQQ